MAMVDINWNPSRKELRVFSLLLIVFSGVVSWSVYHKTGSADVAKVVFAVAATVGVLGFFLTSAMRWVYVVWMIAVFPIGWVVSHLLMAIIFYLVFTPIGLMMKMFGHDSLNRKFDRDAPTYWTERSEIEDHRRYFRQF